MVADTDPGVQLTVLQILLGLFTLAASGYAIWLYRHERWFRNIVFPVIQSLTGDSPRGRQVDSTTKGHFQETENRLQKIEDDVDELKESVDNLQRRQDKHNTKTQSYLRRVVAQVEGISYTDVDEPLFRGGRSGNDNTNSDGGPSPGDD